MIQQTLFGETDTGRPLASRMRPRTLEEFAGQRHLLGEGKVLRQLIDGDRVPSMVFWGPPGVGKTTLARIIANRTKANFIDFSAVTSGIKEIKEVMQTAEANRRFGEQTILFVDEIHRFNKAQQDAFLPFVEKGSIILIGATTENPSFEINSALLSRCKVFVLHGLSAGELTELLRRALTDPRGFGGRRVELAEGMLEMIANFANGDARTALNTLEMVVLNGDILPDGSTVVPMETLEQCISKKSLLYDKHGEEHYNLISALHKSMRNSDPDAAVYWLARMLEAGEGPLYVARRLVRFASEDVGLADSRALEICVAAYQACHFLGMPECTVHLTHAAVYLSAAPKSNALYKAYETAKKDALEMLDEPVPLVIRNAPTRLMKELHYGEGYQYAHDAQDKLTDMQCLPDSLQGRHYYVPTEQGSEARVAGRLAQIEAWRAAHRQPRDKEEEECNAPRRYTNGAGRFPHTGPPGISHSVGAYRLTKHRKRGRAAWNRRRQRSGRLSLRRKRAGCASMSFGCRSLSVPNSAPRRLPDATAPAPAEGGEWICRAGPRAMRRAPPFTAACRRRTRTRQTPGRTAAASRTRSPCWYGTR